MAAVAVLVLLALVGGAAAAVTDVFAPACGSLPGGTPTRGWKKWSDASAWANGVVPGGGRDAVVPCNAGIVLDVKTVVLDKLIINGWLKVQDAGPFQVSANFVVVQGRLTIGTPLAPYGGKVTFNLTGGGYEYTVTQGTKQMPIGTRAFAVVGGLVEMNGMYKNQRSWTTLLETAPAGARSILVAGDLSAWPVGGTIAIASTDYNYKQAETRRITSVVTRKRYTLLNLDRPLNYMHWGVPIQTGIPGVTMDQSAQVALLTRAIVIQGSPNPSDPLIGGHFIVAQTPLAQQILGVEFVSMGQQGLLGRYALHFHLCQSLAAGALVSKSAIHDSLQRCLVVHGTHGLRADGNVAFNTRGHCFFVEDGIERDNTFSRNLGFSTLPAQRLIPQTQGGATQSDDAPSTFWTASVANKWIDNVAAGGADSGYWFQLAETVLGLSALFPGADKIYPKFQPLMRFVGNSAHSYMRTGLRTYSIGYRPRRNGGGSAFPHPINAPAVDVVISKFQAWKNAMDGLFIHETDSIILDEAMIADNAVVGVELHQVEHCIIQNSIILGETANIGNPDGCNDVRNEFANCRAISGCQFPVDPKKARSAGAGQTKRNGIMIGVLIDQSEYPSHGLTIDGNSRGAPLPQHFRNVSFGKFNADCRVAAGISANGKTPNVLFSAGHSGRALRWLDGGPRLYFAPRPDGILGFETAADAGPLAAFYVFRDEDGSTVGGRGGFAVTNSPALLPAGGRGCTFMPKSNGYFCPNTCYRSIAVTTSGISSPPTFTITRVADGVSMKVTMLSTTTNFINLLANSPYKISITPTPASVSFWYGDPEGCDGSLSIQLDAPSGKSWKSTDASWRQCAGSTTPVSTVSQIFYVCNRGQNPILQIELGGKSRRTVTLYLNSGTPSCSTMECGLVPTAGQWQYSDNGQGLSSGWSAPSSREGSWRTGTAMFGYGVPVVTTIRTGNQNNGVVWYFKSTFNYIKASCMTTLKFGIVVNDGVVVYMNGKEFYRNNMPSGSITPSTKANGAGQQYDFPGFTEVSLDINKANLVTGSNTIAVEVHAWAVWSWNIRFDLWMTAVGSGCSNPKFYRM